MAEETPNNQQEETSEIIFDTSKITGTKIVEEEDVYKLEVFQEDNTSIINHVYTIPKDKNKDITVHAGEHYEGSVDLAEQDRLDLQNSISKVNHFCKNITKAKRKNFSQSHFDKIK